MKTPLLDLQVSSTLFLQCFYFFILSLSHSVFSPSLSCTHARPGSVGVWRMTHLLHTSSLPDHIWAARKSIFLQLCSGEKQANAETKWWALFYFLFSSILFFWGRTSTSQGQIFRYIIHKFCFIQGSFYSMNVFRFFEKWIRRIALCSNRY